MNPDYLYVESFEHNATFNLKAKKNKLFFDSKGRRKQLITYSDSDSISLEWIYDEANKKTTQFVNGYQKRSDEFNEKNQLTSRKSDAGNFKNIYDESGRLINSSYDIYGNSLFYKYKYNKKNLPKAKYKKDEKGKFKKVKDYDYEYF